MPAPVVLARKLPGQHATSTFTADGSVMSARLVRSAGCIGFVMFSDVFERFNAAKRAAQFFNATSTSSPFNPTTHGGYSPHSCALSRSTSLALRAIPD
jgi:hypothetical protein